MRKYLFVGVFIICAGSLLSQNIAITDDDAYTASTSAMLDVKSLTKGLLIPRMTTVQRNSIATPATGLLVFDTNINGFYYYNGTIWINLTSGSASGPFWSYTSPNIYMSTGTDKLGLGISTPLHKLHLYESVATTDGTDGNYIDIQNANNTTGVMSGIRFMNGTTANTFKGAIFYRDSLANGRGNLILANNTTNSATNVSDNDARIVLQSDGRVMVKGDPNQGVNAAIFAVQNSDGDTVFAVYPEGVRVWVNDDGLSKATGNRGGFAVGGFSPSKAGFTNEYLRVTPDSVRVYIDDEFIGSKAAGNRGGFAVGGFSPSKGSPTDQYFFVQDDSTRVYVADSTQGFGVENIEGVLDQRIMRLTTDNYLVGHQSGVSLTGTYNSFFGYQTAPNATSASNNVLIGYKAGFSLTTGFRDVIIGYSAGLSTTTGAMNVFIGNEAGESNTTGFKNIFIGDGAGNNSISGYQNVMIGEGAGYLSQTTCSSVIIGQYAGYNSIDAYGDIFIGLRAGYDNSTGLGCTFVGLSSGESNTTGNSNSFYGMYSGMNSTIGSDNTYLGNCAGLTSTTGAYNVSVGSHAGRKNVTGNGNVCIGYSSGYNSLGSNNVLIGYAAGYNEAGSNRLYIENSSAASSSALIYGEFDSNILVFNGNVGISTLTPDNKLDVNGKISVTQSVGDEMVIINDDVWQHYTGNQDFGIGGDHFLMASRETASESAGIYGDGDHVTIWSAGDGAPGQAAAYLYILDEDLFNGTIDSDPFNNGAVKAYVTNAGVWQVSDITKKQNIIKLQNAISKIKSLNGYTYEFKLNQNEIEKNQKAEVSSGISAQELELVLPEAVQTNSNGDKFVNYSSVVPLLIEGMKEQQVKIEQLENELNKLKEGLNK